MVQFDFLDIKNKKILEVIGIDFELGFFLCKDDKTRKDDNSHYFKHLSWYETHEFLVKEEVSLDFFKNVKTLDFIEVKYPTEFKQIDGNLKIRKSELIRGVVVFDEGDYILVDKDGLRHRLFFNLIDLEIEYKILNIFEDDVCWKEWEYIINKTKIDFTLKGCGYFLFNKNTKEFRGDFSKIIFNHVSLLKWENDYKIIKGSKLFDSFGTHIKEGDLLSIKVLDFDCIIEEEEIIKKEDLGVVTFEDGAFFFESVRSDGGILELPRMFEKMNIFFSEVKGNQAYFKE